MKAEEHVTYLSLSLRNGVETCLSSTRSRRGGDVLQYRFVVTCPFGVAVSVLFVMMLHGRSTSLHLKESFKWTWWKMSFWQKMYGYWLIFGEVNGAQKCQNFLRHTKLSKGKGHASTVYVYFLDITGSALNKKIYLFKNINLNRKHMCYLNTSCFLVSQHVDLSVCKSCFFFWQCKKISHTL